MEKNDKSFNIDVSLNTDDNREYIEQMAPISMTTKNNTANNKNISKTDKIFIDEHLPLTKNKQNCIEQSSYNSTDTDNYAKKTSSETLDLNTISGSNGTGNREPVSV